MGSLPEVVYPVFFYLLVYGLCKQGCILMKALWREFAWLGCCVLDSEEPLLSYNGFFLCRYMRAKHYQQGCSLESKGRRSRLVWEASLDRQRIPDTTDISGLPSIIRASWVQAMGSGGVKSGCSGARLPESEFSFHFSVTEHNHGQNTKHCALQFLHIWSEIIGNAYLIWLLWGSNGLIHT